MSNNVFKQYYCPWRYPSNWIKNIRLFFRRYKWAYQRATRGYADCDIWDMDSWILNLFHDSLNHLADNHMGYPGDDRYPTDEEWTTQLKDLAQLFYQANESNDYYPTPVADKWYEWRKEHQATWVDEVINGMTLQRYNQEESPYDKAMIEEANRNDKMRDADFHRAWNIMGSLFWNLWD